MANSNAKNIHQILAGDASDVSDAMKEKARIISNCTKISFNKVLKILCNEKLEEDFESLKPALLKKAA